MITKFLYQMNAKNKRILTGLVENDVEEVYDPLREIPMVLESSYTPLENENKVSNFGRLYYAVFNEGKEYRYLNINDYMLKVKVNASDKVAFASPLSKEMIESILDNTNYLNCDFDVNYVDSGLKLKDNLEQDDSYVVFFKKVQDDCYVQLTTSKKPQYVSVVEGNYDLVDDFKEAMRVYKKEVRNLLITHNWVNKDVKKADVAFSHFNCFTNGPKEYLFGGENSFKISLIDNKLSFEYEPEITNEYRLANDEVRSQLLRNVLYGFKKPKSHVNKLLKVNDLYVSKIDKNHYELADVASKASALPLTEIEILKNAISLFIKEAKFYEIENNNMVNYYLYNDDNNCYEVSTKVEEKKSVLLNQEVATNYIHEFREYDENKGNYILKSNTAYVKYIQNESSFELKYLESGFDASTFTLSQVSTLEALLNKKFEHREIEKIFGAKEYLRVQEESVKSIVDLYNDFLVEKNSTNIRFSHSIDLANIKYGSDKGSYEYFEYLYVKAVLDSKRVFDRLISKVNNILIVGSTAGLDLTALSMSCDEASKKVNVTLLDTTKWGYYPKCYVSNNVNFEGAYRLELESLPKSFIEKFDLIFVGKTFKGNKDSLVSLINSLKEDNYQGFIANVSLSKEYGFDDPFNDSLSASFDYKKYLLNLKLDDIKENLGNSILEPQISNYSIIRINKNEVKDAIRRK